ncbi:MAG: hypothetical protein ILN61_00905 [Lachnospiraceae bacterium]|nr:hypothetical protein [Lachnospiraceae bacterium]MBP5413788.1 hypothetical protein [Lachnospiraceae bacterium]
MKKKISLIMICTCLILLSSCGSYYIPPDWYDETLAYYEEGFKSGWKNEKEDLYISDELKDESIEFGYLLKDLDGDKADELLIGIIDDSDETKFTDIYIWHRDIGAFRIMSAGEGYYMYLCDSDIIREDSWYGSQTKTNYMRYDSKDNSFLIVDGGSKPKKVELTRFKRGTR